MEMRTDKDLRQAESLPFKPAAQKCHEMIPGGASGRMFLLPASVLEQPILGGLAGTDLLVMSVGQPICWARVVGLRHLFSLVGWGQLQLCWHCDCVTESHAVPCLEACKVQGLRVWPSSDSVSTPSHVPSLARAGAWQQPRNHKEPMSTAPQTSPDQHQTSQVARLIMLPRAEVEFPGINAPIPPGADPAAWGLNPLTGAPFAPLNTPGHPPGPPGLPPGPPGPDYGYGVPPPAPTSLPPTWGPFHAGLSHSHLPGHPVQQQYGLQSQGGVGLSHVASQQPQGAAEPSPMYQQPGGPMDQTLQNPTWNPGQQHAGYFSGHLPYHQQQHSSSHQQQHHPPSFGHAPGMHDPVMQMGSPPPGFSPPPHLAPSFHGGSPPFEHRRSGGYRR